MSEVKIKLLLDMNMVQLENRVNEFISRPKIIYIDSELQLDKGMFCIKIIYKEG